MKIFKNLSLYLLSVLFIGIGINHFIHVSNFLKIIPPYVPFPLAGVYISGIFEILLGAGLLIKRFRRYAAIGLILLLIAVLPANVYMYTSGEFPQYSQTLLLIRLPLQVILIAWAAWFAKKEPLPRSN
ncbi:MAG: DoxX family membrane protein [Chitinophagales bacterium]|nr:DoxX family membrane protein [Chitinophagales bacterium]